MHRRNLQALAVVSRGLGASPTFQLGVRYLPLRRAVLQKPPPGTDEPYPSREVLFQVDGFVTALDESPTPDALRRVTDQPRAVMREYSSVSSAPCSDATGHAGARARAARVSRVGHGGFRPVAVHPTQADHQVADPPDLSRPVRLTPTRVRLCYPAPCAR